MNTIVYQAYGNLDILNECLFSLYSLASVKTDCQIVIYTDNPAYFETRAPEELTIHFEIVDEKTIMDWRGEFNFVHRFKVKMLQHLLNSKLETSNILYVDTDTKFRLNLENVFGKIESGVLFMHLDEGNMSSLSKTNPIFRKTLKYARSKSASSQLIPPQQHMWNAGALGFKSKDLEILNRVLDITDQIYAEFPKHIVEQLAFSIEFAGQDSRQLQALDQQIFHYWNFKEFRQILKNFFEEHASYNEIVEHLQTVDPEVLIQAKLEFEKLPKYKKLFRKFKPTQL